MKNVLVDGDTIFLDIKKIKKLLEKIDPTTKLFTFPKAGFSYWFEKIAKENGFDVDVVHGYKTDGRSLGRIEVKTALIKNNGIEERWFFTKTKLPEEEYKAELINICPTLVMDFDCNIKERIVSP